MEVFDYLDNYIKPDWRTKNYPMMSTIVIPVVLSIIYIIIVVFIGPKYMTNKKPFTLKKTIAIYNTAQILACTYLSIEFLRSRPKLGCDPLDVSDDPVSLHVTNLIWWSSILKLAEFIETIFFILRKKKNQISVLHLYHHVTSYILVWIAARIHPGGVVRIFLAVNCMVHTIMYSYYLLSSMGSGIQKKINKFKKYITILQMVQFCFMITNSLISLLSDCPIPPIYGYVYITNVMIVFILFFSFYRKSYTNKSIKEKLKT